MNSAIPKRAVRAGQRGYALALVMFFLALLVVATAAVSPLVITDATREKETEMIWRGKQYVRGVRLYYTKLHRFPTELEDLTKPKTGLRFMRQAYKDPMNTADGSWRLIYVGPNGQLIGSTKNRNVNLGGQQAAGFGTPLAPGGANSSPFGAGFGGSTSAFGNSGFGNSNASGAAGQLGSNANGPQNPATGSTAGSPDNPAGGSDSLNPQPIAETDTSNIVGGNIIGVGSKINKKSFKWYEKARVYRQFEFIWDPSVDSVTGQSLGSVPQNVNPLGSPATGANPNAPQSNSPNPNPQPNPPLPTPPPDAPPQQ